MKYAISRSINGISLNGKDFLLTVKGDVMTFDSKAAAISFAAKIATGKDGSNIDPEEFGINICQIDDEKITHC
ncbi:MAG: hypothetical protein DRP56_09530 [Planctomycetota bacterium]|nr:MAG: hypothetical protein DRP56_09530 [Planctomycetota bacterium]